MKINNRKYLFLGLTSMAVFMLWTVLITTIDIQPVGVNGTKIGFAELNLWFHSLWDINMSLYNITDWLGLVPVFVCICFASLGFFQLIKRRSFLKVDIDIITLGIYYIIVISCYLIFEMIPINYRPILINGFMEASYPSSTTLLVMCVMPTLILQAYLRLRNDLIKRIIYIVSVLFTLFMVLGRLISGVHWLTDIIGSALLSIGLFSIYKSVVLFIRNE